jgi:hypothetical protein
MLDRSHKLKLTHYPGALQGPILFAEPVDPRKVPAIRHEDGTERLRRGGNPKVVLVEGEPLTLAGRLDLAVRVAGGLRNRLAGNVGQDDVASSASS